MLAGLWILQLPRRFFDFILLQRIREIKLEDGPTGENKMLRLSVEGGGCSGFLYNFALDDKDF